jgi:hypothetical protein
MNGKSPFPTIMLGFGKLSDVIGGVAQRSRRRAIWQANGWIERTVPRHCATPQQNLGFN